jgi:peptidoglycan/xylan/chitin deacetylase (PgdA/CDA1 family)
MAEIGSTTRVNGRIHAVLGQDDASLASSPLARCRKALHKALGSTGFVAVTGQLNENFRTYLDREPFKIEVGDLKPGMLDDLTSRVASEIAGDADQAQRAQARIQPERAVKLLT